MDLLEIIVSLILGGPLFWVGVAIGVAGAWAAWTYLPTSVDRASISALVLIAPIVLVGVFAWIDREKRK